MVRLRQQAPSFQGLRPASAAASAAKRANPATGTRCERLLAAELRARGFSFSDDARALPGRPDFIFEQERLLIFCDGDFWHGRRWAQLRSKLAEGSNGDYWVRKIKANRSRDRRHDRLLTKAGWRGVRLWECDILASPGRCAELIARALRHPQSLPSGR